MRALIVLLVLAGTAHAGLTEDDLIAVITIQPRAPYAEAYADRLLDVLGAANRTDELNVWVERMAQMPQLLRGREKLRQRLQRLQIAFRMQKANIDFHRGSETGSVDAWRDVVRGYRSIAELQSQLGDNNTVARFNVAVALDRSGEHFAAFVAWGSIHELDLEIHARERMVAVLARSPLGLLAWLPTGD